MEKSEKNKQYEYKSNSNLVLNAEKGSRDHGPSSDVVSLSAKMTKQDMMKQMGAGLRTNDRASELAERLKRSEKKRGLDKDEEENTGRKNFKPNTSTVLSAEVEAIYKPQTKETRAAYEVILSFIQGEMGDKPHDVLRSAADEVLAVLKDDTMKAREKQKEIESLFRTKMDEAKFSRLINMGNKITDFLDESNEADDALDEEMGVPVVFDDFEEEDNDLDVIDVRDEQEDESMLEEAKQRAFTIEAKVLSSFSLASLFLFLFFLSVFLIFFLFFVALFSSLLVVVASLSV